MPSLKIYGATITAEWFTNIDVEGLDDAVPPVAIPGTRRVVAIPPEKMAQIVSLPLAQRGAKLLSLMDEIDSSLGKANLLRLIAANQAGKTATETFVASLTFPITLKYS